MITIGCDVGKNYFDIFLDGKYLKFENNNKGISKFIKSCKGKDIEKVVLEPTGGYEKNLLKQLGLHAIPVSRVNPWYIRSFANASGDLAKTDKIDAKLLSHYGEKMDSKLYEAKGEYLFDLEALTLRRDNIVQMLKEENSRLEKEAHSAVIKDIKKHIKYLEKTLENIETEIKNNVEKNVSKESEILRSEKGIGEKTVAILLSQLPELGKIDNRKIAKLVGVAPMAHDSGVKTGKRFIRGGRKRVRNALFMASLSAIKSNPKVKDFYQRLRSDGKPGKTAIVAVMRKLLIILNAKMRLFYEQKTTF